MSSFDLRKSILALLLAAACDRQDEAVAPPRPAPAPPAPASAASAPAEPAGLAVRSGAVPEHPLWGFVELDVDLRRVRLEIAARPGGARLDALLPPGALAVLNGGYFDASYRPTTWVTSAGQELSPKSSTTRGGVLAVAGERAFVGPLAALPFEPELAVQSFPLVLELDGSDGIRTDDGKRAARTIACTAPDRLRFVLITARDHEGPTLYETMSLLRGSFGCTSALNLDGGPSTGVWFGGDARERSRLPLTPVSYGIAIVPRTR